MLASTLKTVQNLNLYLLSTYVCSKFRYTVSIRERTEMKTMQYELVVSIVPGCRLHVQDGNFNLPENVQVLLKRVLYLPETPRYLRTTQSSEYW
jgi:hypothetical protein